MISAKQLKAIQIANEQRVESGLGSIHDSWLDEEQLIAATRRLKYLSTLTQKECLALILEKPEKGQQDD